MRQPAKPLPKLGNRSALGSLDHADQHRALCARPRSISVTTETLAVAKSAPSEGGWIVTSASPARGLRVVFFDTSMLSEAPSRATPAGTAAKTGPGHADPDRALRYASTRCALAVASRFVSPRLVSTFAPLFVCLRGCLLPSSSSSVSASPIAMLAPHKPGTWSQARWRPRRGHRHGQQCFPCRGSRAEIMAGQTFFSAAQLLRTP